MDTAIKTVQGVLIARPKLCRHGAKIALSAESFIILLQGLAVISCIFFV